MTLRVPPTESTGTGDPSSSSISRTVGGNDTPTDPDGDGRYEDVNGNGQVDYDDVVVLFTEKETGAVQNHPDAYDFNDNSGVDFDDIVDLAGEVSGD